MRAHLALAALLLACALAAACSSDKSPSLPSATGAPSTTAPGPSPTPAVTRNSDLSLVYVDTSKGQGTEVYVSAFDGASPRLVTSLPKGGRVMDVNGNLVAVSSERQISFVDLKTTMVRNVTVPNLITDGRFVDSNTLVYTTYSGCGPPNGSQATVSKIDSRTLQNTELIAPDNRTMNIAGFDAAAGQVAITLRGCDVGVHDIAVYSLTDGKPVSTINTQGCGWALTALAFKKALVDWQFCTPSADKVNVDVTLLDLSSTPPGVKDLKGPAGGANLHEFRLRPGQPQAALGSQMPGTPGPSFKPVPTGLWLLDLNSGAFSNLAPGDGLEQYPVAWSPDGRLLLAATVHAQGICDYVAIDATTKQATPLAKTLTYCGANGDVLGWTVIK